MSFSQGAVTLATGMLLMLGGSWLINWIWPPRYELPPEEDNWVGPR
jgi:hypothetical protein